MAQNTQKNRQAAKRTLAAKVIRHRRALKSHSKVLDAMNNKYLEVRDIVMDLKEVIEGTDYIGSISNLHFDLLQVP